MMFLLVLSSVSFAQANKIAIVNDGSGSRIKVDNRDFMIIGMNWDYFPIGTNYSYSLWAQSDDFIKSALDREMSLLKNMGVNTIRMYVGIQPRWITYIYEHYGIYTILNHPFGRYGVTVNGAYIPNTDYADPLTRKTLLSEIKAITEEYRNTPGLLLWLLGNENNYGLFWGGAATENIPVGETLESVRARHMYNLFNEAILSIKAQDSNHPVAIANGDLQFINIIADEVPSLDILGTNMYRGISFGDAFDQVKQKLHKPMMFTEFGCDAFNAKEMHEDQLTQARYLLGNWQEIYEQSAGKGKSDICIGGCTFQFSDGWWKTGMESNLDVHDATASWSNGGYKEDFVEGENNMNEEWFGICAKGATDQSGHYELYPRAAYYALQKAYSLNPFAAGINLENIQKHFNSIDPNSDVLRARGDQAALKAAEVSKLRVSGLRIDMETFNTGGKYISTPSEAVAGSEAHPAFLGFDRLESVYAEFEAQPADNVTGKVSLNILGNVPQNPIDEIFYENHGLPKTVSTETGTTTIADNERVKIYKASISWEHQLFKLDGFYRTGHYHWGYEGDFFGLYPEANYGINADIYNSNAPLGFEIAGKKSFDGLKIAFGPELWWGANPAILIKYTHQIGALKATGIFQDDIAKQGTAVSSFSIPLPKNRKATLHLAYTLGVFGIETGGIWSGSTKVGETFTVVRGTTGNYTVKQDKIKNSDTYGGKLKITMSSGPWHWYAQGAAMGLVADGGADPTITYTGWRLKDCGSGNQFNFLSGAAYTIGNWQIAPNFLWQKPIEGPIPSDVPAPAAPRNVLSDPFAVRNNRETTAGEILINFDPTPATWLYAWDNDIREDAPMAFSLGFVYRHQPTTKDAAIGILGDGRTLFAFPSATMARDVWESNLRLISKLNSKVGTIANVYWGIGEPNGSDERVIHRFGGDLRFIYNSIKLIGSVKVNDWGPYDYHRDFNLTYPLQLMADVSTVFGLPNWFNIPQTQLGVRYTWRSLDKYSNRYAPSYKLDQTGKLVIDLDTPGQPEGNEWEVRTYLTFSI
jgi:hypothetical protein